MILALCSIVISRQVSKVLSVLYACGKTTVGETLIQLTEFVNEISTKIVQSYLLWCHYTVHTKKIRKLLGQTV